MAAIRAPPRGERPRAKGQTAWFDTNDTKAPNRAVDSHTQDLTGRTFGGLLVIGRSKRTNRSRTWVVECQCDKRTRLEMAASTLEYRVSCGACNHDNGWKPSWQLPQISSIVSKYFREYHRDARRRGYSFEIEKEHFHQLVTMPCRYCARPPARRRKHEKNRHTLHLLVNGIDRVDNNIGYTRENVVPCCEICNRAKSAMSQSDFESWLNRIAVNVVLG